MKLRDEEAELKIEDKKVIYKPVSKFPPVTRDLAFIVNSDIDTSKVEKEIGNISELISRVELFDEFSSDKFGQNKKNIAFHLYLQGPDRTLTDKEADEIIDKVINQIRTKYSAQLRES
jgi:phenylalanyl-tRNA synthetase beta chain